MSGARKALGVTAALGLLIAGCTAAAHLKALQPAPLPSSPPLGIPGKQPKPVTPRKQLGIDIAAYTHPGQDVTAAAQADIAYIRSLHANSVSISIPFFMSGPGASTVHATSATPSPAQVAVIARIAEQAGLYVSIRPLLDEKALGESRTEWLPPNLSRWFSSYQRFLLPYTAIAQLAGIPEVIAGAELTRFATSPRWDILGDNIRRHGYQGRLAFANNGHPQVRSAGGKGWTVTVDAYPVLTENFSAGWRQYDRTLPPRTVLSEVGIAAVPGAFVKPWAHHWPTSRIDPSVQARWFTAACRAARAEHLGGIYFWSLGLSREFAGPSPSNQLAWANSQGARAISACFASLEGR